MSWCYLFIAGVFEISWAIGLKLSNGFTNFGISVVTVIGMILSYYFLALALKDIPLGTSYAVWTGMGIIGTAIFGMLVLNEPVNILRILCISMILFGIAGLKFLS